MAMAAMASGFIEERWPVIVCAAEVLIVICASTAVICRHERYGRRCTWDASRMEVCIGIGTPDFVADSQLWSTCGGALHPVCLFAFRAVAFLYFVPILVVDIVIHGAFAYRFYTQWTFTLTVIYFGLAMILSGMGLFRMRRKISRDEQAQDLLNKSLVDEAGNAAVVPSNEINAGCCGYLLQVMFQVLMPAVLLTDGIYWLVLVPFVIPSGFHSNFLNINLHGINALLMFIEFFANSMPFPWFRGAYFVLWSVLYILFLWMMHITGFRWWPYPFLDVSTPSAPIWYFGLAVLHLISFGICSLLATIKAYTCSSGPPKVFSRSISLY